MRIQLNDVEPAVWRRLLVPAAVRMSTLADILLAVRGWSNAQLHAFEVGEQRYGMDDDDPPEDEIDEQTVTVLQALRGVTRFTFEYDFGDSWEHEVIVEELTRSDAGLKHAVCLDGANACPPEDVGGPPGYSTFLRAITDPGHEEHEAYLEWVDGSFDPTAFDLGKVNTRLQKLR